MTSIVKDIYKYLESYKEVSDEEAFELGYEIAKVVKEKLATYRKPSLSMSSIGKPERRLWMDLKHPKKPNGQMRLRFLYGDIVEQIIIWLCRMSGHTVSNLQDKVEIDGVPGSCDLLLDGELRDVKSCSAQNYKKFKEGTLPQNDPFGYLAQLAGYNAKFKTKHPGFLAFNKETGELCEYLPDTTFELPNPKAIIKEAKACVKSKTAPKKPCAEPEPMGESGNMKLPTCCKYCNHIKRCWPKARAFKYANGTEYLTKIVKVPNVKEIKKW